MMHGGGSARVQQEPKKKKKQLQTEWEQGGRSCVEGQQCALVALMTCKHWL